MNNNKKTIIAIIAVAMIAIVTFGGTYAYWIWQSDAGNETAINFVISQPSFTITGTNVSSTNMVPTTNCAHATYAIRGKATVNAQNNTGTLMTATITLKGRLTPVSGRTLSPEAKGHIHWAIKEVASLSTEYATANCNGTAGQANFDTGTFASVGTSNTDITTSITFNLPASNTNTITKYYQIYAWIDSNYNYTTTGGAVTDPMQGLGVYLTFSETSNIAQVTTQ